MEIIKKITKKGYESLVDKNLLKSNQPRSIQTTIEDVLNLCYNVPPKNGKYHYEFVRWVDILAELLTENGKELDYKELWFGLILIQIANNPSITFMQEMLKFHKNFSTVFIDVYYYLPKIESSEIYNVLQEVYNKVGSLEKIYSEDLYYGTEEELEEYVYLRYIEETEKRGLKIPKVIKLHFEASPSLIVEKIGGNLIYRVNDGETIYFLDRENVVFPETVFEI